MSEQTNSIGSAIRQVKFLVVPALLIAGWLAVFGNVVRAMSHPQPLRASIEQVLRTHSAAEPTTDLLSHR